MKNKEIIWSIVAILVIVLLWLVLPYAVDDKGRTAVGALFSGLAFGGLIVTILLQRRDINESRKDQSEAEFLSSASMTFNALVCLLEFAQREKNHIEVATYNRDLLYSEKLMNSFDSYKSELELFVKKMELDPSNEKKMEFEIAVVDQLANINDYISGLGDIPKHKIELEEYVASTFKSVSEMLIPLLAIYSMRLEKFPLDRVPINLQESMLKLKNLYATNQR